MISYSKDMRGRSCVWGRDAAGLIAASSRFRRQGEYSILFLLRRIGKARSGNLHRCESSLVLGPLDPRHPLHLLRLYSQRPFKPLVV